MIDSKIIGAKKDVADIGRSQMNRSCTRTGCLKGNTRILFYINVLFDSFEVMNLNFYGTDLNRRGHT